jgi:hypothetical protein
MIAEVLVFPRGLAVQRLKRKISVGKYADIEI